MRSLGISCCRYWTLFRKARLAARYYRISWNRPTNAPLSFTFLLFIPKKKKLTTALLETFFFTVLTPTGYINREPGRILYFYCRRLKEAKGRRFWLYKKRRPPLQKKLTFFTLYAFKNVWKYSSGDWNAGNIKILFYNWSNLFYWSTAWSKR